jgi:hypothetical protein
MGDTDMARGAVTAGPGIGLTGDRHRGTRVIARLVVGGAAADIDAIQMLPSRRYAGSLRDASRSRHIVAPNTSRSKACERATPAMMRIMGPTNTGAPVFVVVMANRLLMSGSDRK